MSYLFQLLAHLDKSQEKLEEALINFILNNTAFLGFSSAAIMSLLFSYIVINAGPLRLSLSWSTCAVKTARESWDHVIWRRLREDPVIALQYLKDVYRKPTEKKDCASGSVVKR